MAKNGLPDFDAFWKSILELKESQKETDRQLKETDRILTERFNETDRMLSEKFKETSEKFKETNLILSEKFNETDRILSEKFNETSERFKETEQLFKETDRRLKDLGVQIGGVHKSFGNFTEDLMFNSLRDKVLNKFNCDSFEPHVEKRIKDENFEADAFAQSNGEENKLYVIEIKSRFKKEALLQLENTIYRVNKFYPEHRTKKKYGILAVPYLNTHQLHEILDAGFYPATMKGDLITIEFPENFKPKEF